MCTTHQHGRSPHSHHNVMRTGYRSSCHNRFSRPLRQIVCPLKRHGICCTRNRLRANAYPCRTSPKSDDFYIRLNRVNDFDEITFESIPMVLLHSSQLLANTFSQHLMQYGCSSRKTYRCPVRLSSHCQQQKWPECQSLFMAFVYSPLKINCERRRKMKNTCFNYSDNALTDFYIILYYILKHLLVHTHKTVSFLLLIKLK